MHSITDNAVPAALLRDIRAAWPAEDDPRWLRYSSPGEIKLAMRDDLPPVFSAALAGIDWQCPAGLVTDPSRHGAGLHHMPAGGRLDCHLDCDRHPATGFRRAVNAILFIDDFLPSWGGDLMLYEPDLSGAAFHITPRAGRLVTFETSDDSFHGVPGPICGPIPRRSLAVYWWQPMDSDWQPKRARAQFVALQGEVPDAAKDTWRKLRCQQPVLCVATR